MYKLLKMKKGSQNNCPFPHKVEETGKEYFETNASSGLSPNGAFNCFVCGRSYTDETWFTSAYLNVSTKQAERWLTALGNARNFLPSMSKWKVHQTNLKKELENKESKYYKYLEELELLEMVDDARLGLYMDYITMPYVYKGLILNLTQFCPGETPKYRNSRGSITGIVGTTRRFKPNKDYIIIAAGEKDMLTLNNYNFNAITILGGEKAKPFYYKNLFKNKKVYIAYDNDKAGKEGATDLAKWLYRYTEKIKILNVGNIYNELEEDFIEVAKEDKEDITDYFIKYNKNDLDLSNLIENTMWYQPPALENQTTIELINEVKRVLEKLTETIYKENKNLF